MDRGANALPPSFLECQACRKLGYSYQRLRSATLPAAAVLRQPRLIPQGHTTLPKPGTTSSRRPSVRYAEVVQEAVGCVSRRGIRKPASIKVSSLCVGSVVSTTVPLGFHVATHSNLQTAPLFRGVRVRRAKAAGAQRVSAKTSSTLPHSHRSSRLQGFAGGPRCQCSAAKLP